MRDSVLKTLAATASATQSMSRVKLSALSVSAVAALEAVTGIGFETINL